MAAERFPDFEIQEVQELKENSENQNTKKSKSTWPKVWTLLAYKANQLDKNKRMALHEQMALHDWIAQVVL